MTQADRLREKMAKLEHCIERAETVAHHLETIKESWNDLISLGWQPEEEESQGMADDLILISDYLVDAEEIAQNMATCLKECRDFQERWK